MNGCYNRGKVIESLKNFAKQHEREFLEGAMGGEIAGTGSPRLRNCIQLAACTKYQLLPVNLKLLADLSH